MACASISAPITVIPFPHISSTQPTAAARTRIACDAHSRAWSGGAHRVHVYITGAGHAAAQRIGDGGGARVADSVVTDAQHRESWVPLE